MGTQFYIVIHIAGVMLMYMALGALAVLSAKVEAQAGKPLRRFLIILHGLALTVILVAGFGLLAKIKLADGSSMSNPATWPPYMWIKVVLWMGLGASTVLLRRQPTLLRPLLVILPLVGALAAYLGVYQTAAF